MWIPALIYAGFAVTPGHSGNAVDFVADHHLTALSDDPYFLAPTIAAFLLGTKAARLFNNGTGGMVWLPATALLFLSSPPGIPMAARLV